MIRIEKFLNDRENILRVNGDRTFFLHNYMFVNSGLANNNKACSNNGLLDKLAAVSRILPQCYAKENRGWNLS
jgi:hypothetical protein